MSSAVPLLEVEGLSVDYPGRDRQAVRVIDTVDLVVGHRETVGLVGESGSGKSTIARAILGLTPVAAGTIRFGGVDITHASGRERRRLSAELQVVFQDPYGSLNPTRTIGQTLAEPMLAHGRQRRAAVTARIREVLDKVGLPASTADRYPSMFSGGQRQRIAIARALMLRPRLVICDEPVSALDLSVQAMVLNLMKDLQRELELSYLFIGHDLAVVRHVSHRIVVLYRGQVMEEGDRDDLYGEPRHPYTQALLAASPHPDPAIQRARRRPRIIETTVSTASVGSDACAFSPRCPHVRDVCRSVRPELEPASPTSFVACYRWREIPSASEAKTSASGAAK
jgi:oligopeptide/dipeptide ABC transporter ATP-binding protein